ncbi:hypothetical protein ACFLT5_04005, partial [Chloroflexota bacterium]
SQRDRDESEVLMRDLLIVQLLFSCRLANHGVDFELHVALETYGIGGILDVVCFVGVPGKVGAGVVESTGFSGFVVAKGKSCSVRAGASGALWHSRHISIVPPSRFDEKGMIRVWPGRASNPCGLHVSGSET